VFVVGLCALSLITLVHAVVKLVGSDNNAAHITLVSMFFCTYQGSIGPFFWIYIPEVLKIRDVCYPMAVLWGTQLLLSSAFTFKSTPYADSIIYIVFSACSLVCAALFKWYAVETKGVRWTDVAEAFSMEDPFGSIGSKYSGSESRQESLQR
jgi:hypothetical protein